MLLKSRKTAWQLSMSCSFMLMHARASTTSLWYTCTASPATLFGWKANPHSFVLQLSNQIGTPEISKKNSLKVPTSGFSSVSGPWKPYIWAGSVWYSFAKRVYEHEWVSSSSRTHRSCGKTTTSLVRTIVTNFRSLGATEVALLSMPIAKPFVLEVWKRAPKDSCMACLMLHPPSPVAFQWLSPFTICFVAPRYTWFQIY